MLYTKNIFDENIKLSYFIGDFTETLGVDKKDIFMDIKSLVKILFEMRKIPHNGGIDNASIFKKAANFIVCFMEEKPIYTNLPKSIVSKLSKYDVNAIIAFHVATFYLRDAEIYIDGGENVFISKPVRISDHSYYDILEALSKGNITQECYYGFISLLLEQLTYKTNKQCEYTDESQVNYYKG